MRRRSLCRPGSGCWAGSASRPVRSGAPRASVRDPRPSPPGSFPAPSPRQPLPRVRAKRPAGKRLPPRRGSSGAAAAPSPPASASPAEPARTCTLPGTPRASEPGAGRPSRWASSALRWPCRPSSCRRAVSARPRPAGLHRSGRARLPRGGVPAGAGGKFTPAAARGGPPARHLAFPAMQHAAGAPRGEGCGRSGAAGLPTPARISSPRCPAGRPRGSPCELARGI